MNLRNNEPSEKWTFGKADCNRGAVGSIVDSCLSACTLPGLLWNTKENSQLQTDSGFELARFKMLVSRLDTLHTEDIEPNGVPAF